MTRPQPGRDDHVLGLDESGAPVPPGEYTICLEVAREHGTHQIMRTDMDFNGAPQKTDLKANIEVSAATIDYHRKADAR